MKNWDGDTLYKKDYKIKDNIKSGKLENFTKFVNWRIRK